jgi:AmiR/NasT family two-component response regulator
MVFLITGNADTIYNIRNRNEMTDLNRKLSGHTANLPNRKEIDNNHKGVLMSRVNIGYY